MNSNDKAPEQSRTARYTRDGGADIVQFGVDETTPRSNIVQHGQKVEAQIRHDDGGTLQIGADGTKYLGARVSGGERQTDPREFLDTLTDNAGRGGIRWDDAIKTPENYRITLAGTQVSVATAIRLGFIRVNGNGSVSPNAREILKSAGVR